MASDICLCQTVCATTRALAACVLHIRRLCRVGGDETCERNYSSTFKRPTTESIIIVCQLALHTNGIVPFACDISDIIIIVVLGPLVADNFAHFIVNYFNICFAR